MMRLLLAAALLIGSIANAQEGSIVGWGWNNYGECEVPSPNQDYVSVFAGGST